MVSSRLMGLLVASLVFGKTGTAQRVITGVGTDGAGTTIPHASVEQGSRRIIADDSGRFRLPVANARGVFYVRRIGFKRTDVSYEAGADTTLNVVLHPLAQQLEGQVIEAIEISRALELRGFYRRLQERQNGTNAGQFITAEEIEQRKPHRIGQMLDGRTGMRMQRPDLYTMRAPQGAMCLSASDPRCWFPVGLTGCYMDVYLDGRRLNSVSAKEPAFVDEYILPGHVAGIEIYTTAGKVPPEYQPLSGTCGVILFWTR